MGPAYRVQAQQRRGSCVQSQATVAAMSRAGTALGSPALSQAQQYFMRSCALRRAKTRRFDAAFDLRRNSAAAGIGGAPLEETARTLNWCMFPYRKNGNQFERGESAYCQIETQHAWGGELLPDSKRATYPHRVQAPAAYSRPSRRQRG